MKVFYQDMTWPEVKEAANDDRVVIVPVGSIEDHGLHLPVMTDNMIITSICNEVGRRIPGEAVIMPCAPFGFQTHHMDFPGSIDVKWDTLIRLWSDIGLSLAHHGFKKIIFANGHGSNASALDLAAREVTIKSNSLCASFSWWSLVREEASKLRESEWPGGASHAGEMETSLMLYLYPELVNEQAISKEIPPSDSNFIWRDLIKPAPVLFMDWWSRQTKTGLLGDATVASTEKGEQLFEASVSKVSAFVKEFRIKKINPRQNYQS